MWPGTNCGDTPGDFNCGSIVGDDVYSSMNYVANVAMTNSRPFDWIGYSATEMDQITSETVACQ